MAKQVLPSPQMAFQSGVFSPGAKVYHYLTGTTTPATVYTDEALSVAHDWPIVVDAAGVVPQIFYGGSTALKVVITASDDTAIATIDPVPIVDSSTSSAAGVSFAPVTGNSATNVQDAISNNTTEINKTKGIGALTTAGIVALTDPATDSYAARVLQGSDGVVVANGSGASGAPTFSLGVASQAEAEAGTNNTKAMTPLRVEQAQRDFQTIAAEQATTSGTAFNFTDIPDGVTEVKVFLDGVSLSGTDHLLVQIGDSGGIETGSYDSGSNDTSALVTSTSGFIIKAGAGATVVDGTLILSLANSSSNKWLATGTSRGPGGGLVAMNSGIKSLSATLDRVRLTRTGTDTFDAGAVSVSYR